MPKNGGCPILQSFPILFSLYSLLHFHSEKNIIWSILCYSVVPPVPASEKTRRHSSGMLKKAISKASNLSFLFLNTIPMPSKWKRKRMEIRHSGFLWTAAPRGTSRHHRKQRRIFIFHPGTTASHIVGGHVMRHSLDCSGCRRNLHPPGRHCSEETQYQKSAASLASNDPGKHQENSVAGGQAVLVSPLFSKSCLSAVGNTIQ